MVKMVVMGLKKEGATKITLFGSYARNIYTPKSDLDVLVKFKKTKSFLDLIRIERELSEKSKVKIDLLTEKGISPLIFDKIKDYMEVVYQ